MKNEEKQEEALKDLKVWHLVGGRPIGPTYEIRCYKPERPHIQEDYYGMSWEETTLSEVLEQYKEHCLFEAARSGLSLTMTFNPKT